VAALLDLVETTIGLPSTQGLPGLELTLLRPRDSEALLDETAFEREEYLPYWAELWPSGLALARALAHRRLEGCRAIEVGCGLAVPSIVAALRGARVLATDWSADAVAMVGINAHRNGVRLETCVCSWADPEQLVAMGPWDLLLAADVLYERRNGELLLELLPRLVARGGEVLIADPGRPATASFLRAAESTWQVRDERDDLAPSVTLYRLTQLA
jgi:predicted nicotinamide N-methyase